MEPKEEIRARINVDELIGEYLELRPAGHMNFKALCPFHGEKTPSFYVSREKQIWHCFGCHKGGDVFAFVMEMEGVDFGEALRILGKKTGVEIPDFTPSKNKGQKEMMLEMHRLATKFYQKILKEHAGSSKAREYLKNRGITDELVDKFQLGFSLDSWDALANFLKKKGFTEKEIVAAGLGSSRKSGSGIIDKFRNRIMIPLSDSRGNVVGFTARLLDGEGPKYLNSPETLIYNKSEVLYGLHLAKTAIRTEKSVIVVEGNLDVVASHKAGVENVVASSGTALTDAQILALKRLTNKMIFSFDSDNAGFKAAKRGIRLAQTQGLDVAVISITDADGQDPDDVVQKNPQRWQELAAKPIRIMDYYFARGLQDFDTSEVEGKRAFSKFILGELGQITDRIAQEHWLQKLSDIVRIEVGVLRPLLLTQSERKPQGKTKEAHQAKASSDVDRKEKVILFIIGSLLHAKEYFEALQGVLDEAHIIQEDWQRIYKDIKNSYTSNESADSTQKTIFSRLSEQYTQNEQHQLKEKLHLALLKTQELISEMDQEQVREELNRHVHILCQDWRRQQQKRLSAAIREAERAGDQEKLKKLLQKYNDLISNPNSRD